MTVPDTVDAGVPTVAVLERSLVDALERAPVPDTDRALDVRLVAREGEVVDDHEPVSVRAAATDAWRVVDRDATLDVVDDLPFVRADPERLRIVLVNLFRNAIEHGDADIITVDVDDDRLIVADDGTGIPEDERANVFDRGFTTNEDGTGFGLAIVEEIADAHRWTAGVDASDDGGARFVLAPIDVTDD